MPNAIVMRVMVVSIARSQTPVVAMEHGYMIPVKPMAGSVIANPAGADRIVPRIIPVAGTETGPNGMELVYVMSAGVAAIVLRITGMIVASMDRMSAAHTVCAIQVGVAVIVPSSNNGVHSDDEQRAGRLSRPSGVPVIPAGAAAIVHKIHERLAIIMETGAGHSVTVIPTGAAAIARLKMPAVDMGIGVIIMG